MNTTMMQPRPATTGFTYGQNIWDVGAQGIILIDSNTMDLGRTPCMRQMQPQQMNDVLMRITNTPTMQVERVTDDGGKVTMNRMDYDAVKNQGDLVIERKMFGYGHPGLLGKIKPLPGFDRVFVMYTSYHNGRHNTWSPNALESALKEYCMLAHLLGVQHLPVYMSMVGLQHDREMKYVPDLGLCKPVKCDLPKWDIGQLQSPAAGMPSPGMRDGINSDILTLPHITDVGKISSIVANVLPLGDHIQVVV